jgi:hypothetical protein
MSKSQAEKNSSKKAELENLTLPEVDLGKNPK